MSRRRHRSRRPAGQRKKPILNSVKEDVVKMRELGLTYNQIADKANISYQSVENIITKWAPNNPDNVKAARAKALEEMAGTIYGKAQEALENITPDSMKHDRIEQFDAQGRLIGVQHSGPNALQLATTTGILVDKAEGLKDKAAKLRGEDIGELGPSQFGELLSSIGDRLSRLGELKIDLDTGQVEARVAELTKELEDNNMIDADFEVVDTSSDGDSGDG